MQDALITEITDNPKLYGVYLDMQADNPTYSPGNIAMVMGQSGEPCKFATEERWRSLGRRLMPGEKDRSMTIFARSNFRRGYDLTPVYDIRQTQGRLVPEISLQDNTKRMEDALVTLMNYSAAPVEVAPDLPVPARYDEVEMKLRVNPTYPDSVAFAAIAAEVALSRIHGKGVVMPLFNRKEQELNAKSVAYILCRRLGIPCERPSAENVREQYDGLDPQQRRGGLDNIQNMCKQIGGNIERSINPQQKNRGYTR